MPMDRSLYPPNWEEIAKGIKDAAGWKCQECGRPCRMKDEDWDDFEERARLTGWKMSEEESDDLFGHHWVVKKGKWILTVAHLNHRPGDCRPDNLKALCSRCHCRYDLSQMELKKQLKRERAGQTRLF